jgi:transcriptional regulator with PAS, ATPase and Fis domain
VSNDETIDAGTLGPRLGRSVGAHAYLVVRAGDDSRVIDLREGDELVLGRGDDAAVRIDDAKASREHVRVACKNGALTMQDLGSRNGTLLNRELVKGEARPLRSGDLMWIGDTEILVAEGATAAEPETPTEGPPRKIDIPGLVVADDGMVEVFSMVERVAKRPTTVLLLGETGVGKEVVAERIHAASDRADKPFVRINCGALPENLLESELFGYERGAFTGADRRKLGLFESAHTGSIFLDEIGELRAPLQAKLLRALEARTIMRLGGREEIPIDVRIIAATNRDLEDEVKKGNFRGDLYFRVSAFTIKIPPLRDRPNEIALLADLFLRRLAAHNGTQAPKVSAEVRALLERYDWPGNVRELHNAMERALVLSDGKEILPGHLPESLDRAGEPAQTPIKARMESVEQKTIEDALAAENGNQTRAARRLGISRRTLVYKLEKYQLRQRDKR